jgi:hypothetical protein
MLALTASHNLSYIGQGPSASGQIIADITSGPKAKTLYAIGTIINDTSASGTTSPIGYIDGIQTLGKTVVLNFQSVTAPATINGQANTAVYSTTGPAGSVPVGASVTFAGFTNAGNNGAQTVTSVNASSISVVNASSVAESNPAATGVYTVGGIPTTVQVFLTQGAGDSTAAVILAAAKSLYATSVTAAGFTLNFPTLTTASAQFTFGAVLTFAS